MQGLIDVIKKAAELPGVLLQVDGRRQKPVQVAEERVKKVDTQLISRFCSIVAALEVAEEGRAFFFAVLSCLEQKAAAARVHAFPFARRAASCFLGAAYGIKPFREDARVAGESMQERLDKGS